MFNFTLNNEKTKLFIKVLNAVNEVIDDAFFDVDIHGIHMTALDACKVCLLDLFFSQESFERFNIHSGNQSLCIKIISLCKILKCSDGKDILNIDYDDSDYLTLSIQNKGVFIIFFIFIL